MRVPRVIAAADAAVLGLWTPGRSAAWADTDELVQIAAVLARTLARIHEVDAGELDRNPVRGCPLAQRDAALREDLRAGFLRDDHERRARDVWEHALAAPEWAGQDLLLHGDPHPANVILPEDDGPTVLIDFGDTTPGDPASDLGGLWLFDPTGGVLDEYRRASGWARDDDAWNAAVARSRGWAVRYAVAMIGAHGDDEGLGRISRTLLERI